MPPIMNTLDNYTNDVMNAQQSEIYYVPMEFGFDFPEQPSAFSANILKD